MLARAERRLDSATSLLAQHAERPLWALAVVWLRDTDDMALFWALLCAHTIESARREGHGASALS